MLINEPLKHFDLILHMFHLIQFIHLRLLGFGGDVVFHHQEGFEPFSVEALDGRIHIKSICHKNIQAYYYAKVPESYKVVAHVAISH